MTSKNIDILVCELIGEDNEVDVFEFVSLNNLKESLNKVFNIDPKGTAYLYILIKNKPVKLYRQNSCDIEVSIEYDINKLYEEIIDIYTQKLLLK